MGNRPYKPQGTSVGCLRQLLGGSFGPFVYCQSTSLSRTEATACEVYFLNNHPFLYVLTLLKTQLPRYPLTLLVGVRGEKVMSAISF
nr:MAG TPA: THYROXINE-BINDING GLOBULIN, CLEAVED PROTEIN [Caudoviricetes sp.]